MKKALLDSEEIKKNHKQIATTLSATLPELFAISRQLRVIGDSLPKEVNSTAETMCDAAVALHVALEAHVKERYPDDDLIKAYEIKLLELDLLESEVAP